MGGDNLPQNTAQIGTNEAFAAQAGKGRPKGVQNKMTKALKEMILEALDAAHEDGGVAYLKDQAEKNPTAFLTLVGKVLPLQVASDPDNPLPPTIIQLVAPQ